MIEPTARTMIKWHYLPELPEREGSFLVAIKGENKSLITMDGRYIGNESWTNIHGWRLLEVYAWAIWPEVPPLEAQTRPSHEAADLIRLGPWFGRITSLLTCDTTGEKFARVELVKHWGVVTEIHLLADLTAATIEQVRQAIDAIRDQQEATWAAIFAN